MGGTSRAKSRRLATGWYERYLCGRGLDIGCGSDPVTEDCDKWDRVEGDAQYLSGSPTYDWVYSSHCLEHMEDPSKALAGWWSLVKPGGYLIIVVPDEDLYEQGHWPSIFNPDHRTTWTLQKEESWSPVSQSLVGQLIALPNHEEISVHRLDEGYDYDLCGATAQVIAAGKLLWSGAIDQTKKPFFAEASLEGIVRKAHDC